MSHNSKKTSGSLASVAAKTLHDPNASDLQKALAGSALSQSGSANQTSGAMEHKASAALHDPNSDELTKKLAGSVLSQANKERK
ncbi:hypothetical protein [Erwinia piriflorinigrans]|uniref:Uncharacterized protein n=1 Tax=Erwinia piriflorinigrans CFBP 5888 TaxID=1161919 RepID=V5Z9T7_9GAMM|nr:hypothetical protein [Erwinia piriflorinigrans]CCG87723.1 hypothetical protein EPIR_2358 [Erwinia piriflorinigrans CFBP 5888]